jgi:hypothetical protein
MHAGVTLRLAHLVMNVPQARSSISHHWFRDSRGQVCMPPIHMAQRPFIAQQALDFTPTGALQLLARRSSCRSACFHCRFGVQHV